MYIYVYLTTGTTHPHNAKHLYYLVWIVCHVNLGCWRPEYEGHAGSRLQRRSSGRYGEYGCDSPWELVESAVNAMKTRQDVDFLLWTGWVATKSTFNFTAVPSFSTKRFHLKFKQFHELHCTLSPQYVPWTDLCSFSGDKWSIVFQAPCTTKPTAIPEGQ